MLLPLSWLKQFVKINATAEQIAAKLTLSGSEVEKIIRRDAGLSRVVVGEIKEIRPHPQAEKLRLAYVDAGERRGLLEIVCGAPNIAVGQKVPAVLAGGSVPGMKIEKRRIRGVPSEGMLASGRELGISDDQAGIFILPDEANAGEDVIKLLQLDDPILELAITPNRADCFSIIGLARETAALYKEKVISKKEKVKENFKKASSVLKVEVKDKALCPKYTARVIENVTVGPSPLWLSNRLRQVGIKSINNIVDITNFVMMETGQPLHAFDFDRLNPSSSKTSPYPSPLKGEGTIKRVIVRSAKKGERILALDGNSYTLAPSAIIIADSKKPIAIAGIMGGEETGVTENTRNIILEAAIFDPTATRKTSRALGLRSESSARFEKGVDLSAIEQASAQAAQLISELSGGVVLKGVVSVETHRMRLNNATIKISTAEVSRLLGAAIKQVKIKLILQSLGFMVRGSSSILTVSVPSWRADVKESADLVEEIGRMIDYNTLPRTLPLGAAQSPKPEKSYELRRHLRRHLAANGYSEILTYSFYDEKLSALSAISLPSHIIVANPVNKEYKYLRASLMPAMFEKLSQNSSLLPRGEFCLFEIGKIFDRKQGESWQAVVGLIDTSAAPEQLYRRLRGILEGFIQCPLEVSRNGGGYDLSAVNNPVIARIVIKNKDELPLRLRSALAVMTIDLAALEKVWQAAAVKFRPLPYYPGIERDLAMIAPDSVQYKEIEDALSGFDPLLKKVELFDVYHGLSAGVSLAFRLTFASTDRTLESREADAVMERLKNKLSDNYKITFR